MPIGAVGKVSSLLCILRDVFRQCERNTYLLVRALHIRRYAILGLPSRVFY